MFSIRLLASALLASTFVTASHLQDAADHYRKLLNFASRRKVEVAAPAAELSKRDDCFHTQYLNYKTMKFAVNGSAIPEVDFDVGESYAGLLPISGDPEESRKLFFWFFPSPNEDARNRITIWFNGGPGCSSLHGLLTEFGPFTWQDGTAAPVPNPYSWTNLTNMIWVEQPVGVGFTQGVPNITNEVELSQEFIGFYKQFVDTFDMHGREVYVTGESYAGMYVPYVADAFVLANDTDYYNIKGVGINDGLIGDRTIQQNAAISPFVDYWHKLLYLNDTYMEKMHAAHDACGFADYMDKYLTFPPPQEPFELPVQLQNKSLPCDIFDDVSNAILEVNPCFDIWHMSQLCPAPSHQLGKVEEGDYQPPNAIIYFNRTDVQAAINAPVGTDWNQCALINVFGGPTDNKTQNDTSVGAANNGVLQRVIEYTNNVFIGSGDLDYILCTNSTLLAIQNMTWNGARGLQNVPNYPLYAPYHPEYSRGFVAGAGLMGTWGSERGLTFYRSQLSGHELPGYTPGVSYRVMEMMFGKVQNLSVVSDFSTQKGDFGNTEALKSEL